jgi:hypothetical protein
VSSASNSFRRRPVSIPTLHAISASAASAAECSSAPTTGGPLLTLASTFIVAGQAKVITALPTDPAVKRLPRPLSVAAARVLQPNLMVLGITLIIFCI